MNCVSWRCYLITAFIINICFAAIMLFFIDRDCDCLNCAGRHETYIRIKNNEHKFEIFNINISTINLSKTVAFVVREFEAFENDIPDTTKSIINVLSDVSIHLISDTIPYPPIQLSDDAKKNIEIITLKPSAYNPFELHQPLNRIQQDHIFIIPDSIRLYNNSQLHKMLEYHYKNPHLIIAAPVKEEDSVCLSMNISLRYWTMKYRNNIGNTECNALQGTHVVLLTKTMLLQFSYPFSKPFLTSLFIQATLHKIKTKVLKDVIFERGKKLFSDDHNIWKHKALEAERKSKLYSELGIKKIVYSPSRVEWHGCNKNSNRCFGTVHNNMPEYLFHGRWTPPCCLENLRLTARYVFGILDKCNVRYWLEGGSLLGAVRTNDIIPWDYDIDIGIYREDIVKCEWLKNSLEQSIVDTKGFVWEKAREGDFIRVQFSQSNHLHVDIFPFYSKNGTMTKDTWFPDHKQDTEFPEYFLKPLYKIKFVGVTASAPNNYRSFLELKFGKNVIENPEYPDPKIIQFEKYSKH